MGFVRTIVRRQVAAQIDQTVHQRRDTVELDSGLRIADDGKDPEQTAMIRERTELARHVLHTISPRDREILTRFYLLEQSQEQICQEMNLTDTQFRLLKSRAKARFGELGKKKMSRAGLTSFFLRASAASLF
jgi:RNA polymerase sigma-70 factor, ECF subfamily